MHRSGYNGPLPKHPHGDVPITDAMKEMEEDMKLRAKQLRRREGLQGDYTKAPWLVHDEEY